MRGQNASRLAALQWARLTLASLEGEARTNKVRIREIGRRFGLATRETSLLVLERVDDYVRHEIEPPPALREAYDRMAATMQKSRAQSDAARLAQVVQRFEARVAWWNREFPKDEPKAPLAIAKSEARGCARSGAVEARPRTRRGADAVESATPRRPAPPAVPMTAPASLAAAGDGHAKRRRRTAAPRSARRQHLDRAPAG